MTYFSSSSLGGGYDEAPVSGERSVLLRRLRAEAGIDDPAVAAGQEQALDAVAAPVPRHDGLRRRWPQVEDSFPVPPQHEVVVGRVAYGLPVNGLLGDVLAGACPWSRGFDCLPRRHNV